MCRNLAAQKDAKIFLLSEAQPWNTIVNPPPKKKLEMVASK
jgi:hypothetical protein